jgi:hypothetical protein
VYYAIGPGDSDFMKYRVSTTAGTTFGPIATATSFHPNFGTGAPGFNREMGIRFPSIARMEPDLLSRFWSTEPARIYALTPSLMQSRFTGTI